MSQAQGTYKVRISMKKDGKHVTVSPRGYTSTSCQNYQVYRDSVSRTLVAVYGNLATGTREAILRVYKINFPYLYKLNPSEAVKITLTKVKGS